MKIEVGKFYRTRAGDVVQITTGREETMRKHGRMEDNPLAGFYEVGGEHPVTGLEGWREDGRYWDAGACGFDLIEEIDDPLTAPVDFAKYGVSPAEKAMQQRLADPAADATARAIEAATERAPNANGAGKYRDINGEVHEYRFDGDVAEIDRHAAKVAIRSLRKSAIYQAVATCLLAIALLYSNAANARDLLWMPNDAGGEIVLTDDVDGCGTARVVFARAVGGRTLMGCWAYTESGYVVARFGSDIRTWRLEDFKPFQSVPARGTRL